MVTPTSGVPSSASFEEVKGGEERERGVGARGGGWGGEVDRVFTATIKKGLTVWFPNQIIRE